VKFVVIFIVIYSNDYGLCVQYHRLMNLNYISMSKQKLWVRKKWKCKVTDTFIKAAHKLWLVSLWMSYLFLQVDLFSRYSCLVKGPSLLLCTTPIKVMKIPVTTHVHVSRYILSISTIDHLAQIYAYYISGIWCLVFCYLHLLLEKEKGNSSCHAKGHINAILLVFPFRKW